MSDETNIEFFTSFPKRIPKNDPSRVKEIVSTTNHVREGFWFSLSDITHIPLL